MSAASVPATVTPAELHWACVKAGAVTILDLFDHLAWYRASADWTAWRAFLCAVYGLPMTEQELRIFQACTGRREPSTAKVREAWVAVGRRGRKSAIAATIGVYEAGFREHAYLAQGEVARVPIISRDKDDAGQIHNYCVQILSDPALRHLVVGEPSAENVILSGPTGAPACELRTRAASITAGRSRSVPCALYDELAFWPTDDSALPDEEIIRGVRNAMANVPDALTVGMSSPYAQRGVLWRKYDELFGQEIPGVLVWNADTLTMHDSPTIRAWVQTVWTDDPVAAAAEVGADGRVRFRTDVALFVPPEVVRAVTPAGIFLREPVPGVRYNAFVDPAGGTSDSMVLAIAHYDGKKAILDAILERAPSVVSGPFQPRDVVKAWEATLDAYGIKLVRGDHWGGEWPAAWFREYRIGYELSSKVKSDIYRDFLPLMTSGSVELLDHVRLRAQLLGLDRRTGRGGHDSIDHQAGQHDDVANAVAGACLMAYEARRSPREVKPVAKTLQEAHLRQLHGSLRERLERQARERRRGGTGAGVPGL